MSHNQQIGKPIGVRSFFQALTATPTWAGHPSLKGVSFNHFSRRSVTRVKMAPFAIVAHQLFTEKWGSDKLNGLDHTYCAQSGRLTIFIEGSIHQWAVVNVPRQHEEKIFVRNSENVPGLHAEIDHQHLLACIGSWFGVTPHSLVLDGKRQTSSFFKHLLGQIKVDPRDQQTAEQVLKSIRDDEDNRTMWDQGKVWVPPDAALPTPTPAARAEVMAMKYPDVQRALKA